MIKNECSVDEKIVGETNVILKAKWASLFLKEVK